VKIVIIHYGDRMQQWQESYANANAIALAGKKLKSLRLVDACCQPAPQAGGGWGLWNRIGFSKGSHSSGPRGVAVKASRVLMRLLRWRGELERITSAALGS